CCENQGKSDSDQSDHFMSSSVTSRGSRRLIKWGSDQTPQARALRVGAGRDIGTKVPQRRLDVGHTDFDVADVKILLLANSCAERQFVALHPPLACISLPLLAFGLAHLDQQGDGLAVSNRRPRSRRKIGTLCRAFLDARILASSFD